MQMKAFGCNLLISRIDNQISKTKLCVLKINEFIFFLFFTLKKLLLFHLYPKKIYIYKNKIKLQNVENCVDGQVCCNCIMDEPSECSCRLWNNDNGIDNGVCDTSNGGHFKEKRCQCDTRVSQHVEQTDRNEWQNVLQIVAMASENSSRFK